MERIQGDTDTQRTVQGREVYRAPEISRTEHVSDAKERTTARAITGGASAEAIGGGAAVVLAIIGLAGFMPIFMAAIATIAIGAALLFVGLAVASRLNTVSSAHVQHSVGGGVGTEVFGGAAGIVLGILALVGVLPFVLLPIAAIVFGGSLMLGGSTEADVADTVSDRDSRAYHGATQASGSVMVLVGIGAVVLGILGILTVGPVLTLTMVSMLAIGGAILLGASALVARFSHRLT
jgi:hypothetical protein